MILDPATQAWLVQAAGVGMRSAVPIQSLWSGYGAIWRCQLHDGRSVILKRVTPPVSGSHSHQRKLRSYAVETHWYAAWAARCGRGCRVPAVLCLDPTPGAWRLLLEDLDAAGFSGQQPHDASSIYIDWLAHFHATFMGQLPEGLWPMGSYWHLQTRPDELAAQADGPLKDAAHAIDERLNAARFQTLIHGDAKVANFCLGAEGVAAVDFQYVGGGCGMKDLAYLVSRGDQPGDPNHLQRYFATLRTALGSWSVDALDDLEAEWRALYPLAWADYCRFLAGWAPHRGQDDLDRSMIAAALRAI
ncbi:MAG: hypothetical protein ACI9VR_003674 [Cognaticolwellia sp.]